MTNVDAGTKQYSKVCGNLKKVPSIFMADGHTVLFPSFLAATTNKPQTI